MLPPPDQVRAENDNYRKKLFVHRCLTAIAIIFGISVLFVRKKRRDDSRTVQEKAVFNDRDEIVCENPDPDKTFLKALEMHIRQAMKSGKVDLEDIASKMCISRTHLNRKVKSITGKTTSEFVLGIRISTAKELLLTTGLPVWEVSARCGIEDPTYFSTLFKKSIGKTPAQFRNENHTVHS